MRIAASSSGGRSGRGAERPAFIAGVAIGSKSFVEEVFNARRSHFGPKRKSGARPIKEAESWVCSLRDLRVQAVE